MSTSRSSRTLTHPHSATFIFVLALLVVFTQPLHAMSHSARHEVRHEIDQLEEQWRNAMLRADIPALEALLAGDYMGITANGTLQTRDDLLNNLRSGTVHFKTMDLSDRKIRFYGTTALVTSRAEVTGTGPSGDFSGAFRYTRVYARSANGTWQVVSFEASRIREEDHR